MSVLYLKRQESARKEEKKNNGKGRPLTYL
jgi:predicted transcriptional regulator